jgi:hypothetical protein
MWFHRRSGDDWLTDQTSRRRHTRAGANSISVDGTLAITVIKEAHPPDRKPVNRT